VNQILLQDGEQAEREEDSTWRWYMLVHEVLVISPV
jgi:hypothetical protein